MSDNVNDQILSEIRERLALNIRIGMSEFQSTKDITYLLNRLDAAEKAAKGFAKENRLLKESLAELGGSKYFEEWMKGRE